MKEGTQMENNENIKEISLEELDKIDGGLIVNRGIFNKYWVVDDQTGDVIAQFSFSGDAIWAARSKGVSDKVISEKEYYKRFKK